MSISRVCASSSSKHKQRLDLSSHSCTRLVDIFHFYRYLLASNRYKFLLLLYGVLQFSSLKSQCCIVLSKFFPLLEVPEN